MNNVRLSQGYLGILLHAHLPYINHRGHSPSTEELWLFEALTESYIPFILSWDRMASEGIDFHLTLSLSPPLLSMITDPSVTDRYKQYLDKMKELAYRETERTRDDPAFRPVAEFYRDRIETIAHAFGSLYRGDLIQPLKSLHRQGHLELITTCATHGFLPLIHSEEARLAQVRVGIELFKEIFGWAPAGLWLPECGYTPGLERILEAQGIRYFPVASHGLFNAYPKAEKGVYAPVRLAGGERIAVFGRDWETSHQVWSRSEGYPGDPHYREFYRDIGYDLDYEYIRPYLVGGRRGDTGFKYYRITGQSDVKAIYNREQAMEQVHAHAVDFLEKRRQQLERLAHSKIQSPIIVAPYDAELFGHWWFEGPEWLESVFRLADTAEYRMETTTLLDYLEENPPQQDVSLGPSSWGDGGFNRVWLNTENDWIYPHLHRAEKKMLALADRFDEPNPVENRLLNQAMRELLLAQSSDWPFILTNQTVVGYAKERINEHLDHFRLLTEQLKSGRYDLEFLSTLENRNRLFAKADYRHFKSGSYDLSGLRLPKGHRPVILMLSWEYPPQHVGGLGIHVRDLAEALVQQGLNVHVLTLTTGRKDESSVRNGVHVHALSVPRQSLADGDFLSWTLQYNLAMADYGRELLRRLPGNPCLIHAHDWMMSYAARELQQTFDLPMVATIHATEHGRNHGLHNDTQRRIHRLESELARSATRVICCSRYMEKEIKELFGIHTGIIRSIPNAVGPIPYHDAERAGRQIIFIGRLVVEKGVQVLLESFSQLLESFPDSRLAIAGDGPYAGELHRRVRELGLRKQVRFTGFISEKVRNELLSQSHIAVFPSLYEPFGIVALEAMAAGVPVVASRTGGLAETVDDGITGLLVEPGDPGELHDALADIFSEPELASLLRLNAREKVEQCYTWDAVASQTKNLYMEILRENSVIKVS